MADVVISTVEPLYTLEEVKAHLLVETADDDDLIQAYADAAEQAVLQYCNLSLVPLGKGPVFKVAALMAVSDFYGKRGSAAGLPAGSKLLIDPYRWLRV